MPRASRRRYLSGGFTHCFRPVLPLAGQAIRLTPLSPRESFIALVKNTFNYRIVNPARLERQFDAAAGVVSVMRVKKVSYPRILARLPEVRDALLADMNPAPDRQAVCGD